MKLVYLIWEALKKRFNLFNTWLINCWSINMMDQIASSTWLINWLVIHEADPQSRPVMINIFTRGVRPFQHFKISQNKQVSNENSDSGTVGLAEWIIKWLFLFFWSSLSSSLQQLLQGSIFCLILLPCSWHCEVSCRGVDVNKRAVAIHSCSLL